MVMSKVLLKETSHSYLAEKLLRCRYKLKKELATVTIRAGRVFVLKTGPSPYFRKWTAQA